jgi:hypothetical protein
MNHLYVIEMNDCGISALVDPVCSDTCWTPGPHIAWLEEDRLCLTLSQEDKEKTYKFKGHMKVTEESE